MNFVFMTLPMATPDHLKICPHPIQVREADLKCQAARKAVSQLTNEFNFNSVLLVLNPSQEKLTKLSKIAELCTEAKATASRANTVKNELIAAYLSLKGNPELILDVLFRDCSIMAINVNSLPR